MSNMNGWQCDACTFLNVEWSLHCEMCNKHNPLCLSLNNVTINEYIDSDNNFNNLLTESDDYEVLNNSGYDEDDYNDSIQCVLMEAASNDTENKTNDNNDNNVDDLIIIGHFNSCLNIEKNEDDFMNVFYQLENSENNRNNDKNDNNYNNDYNENLYFEKSNLNKNKNKNKTSFEQYWLEMQKYNKKNKQICRIKEDTMNKLNAYKVANLFRKRDRTKKGKFEKPKKHTDLMDKKISKYPLLQRHFKGVKSIKNEFKSQYSNVFNVRLIVRPKWIKAFFEGKMIKQGKTKNKCPQIVFHGTDSKNDQSICEKSLLIGGTKGVTIANGSAYGHGIYCSPCLSVATSYSGGSIFVCLARFPQKNGDIWVVGHEKNILPCFLLSYEGGLTSVINHSVALETNSLWRFVPVFEVLNIKDIHRKWRRKWFQKNS